MKMKQSTMLERMIETSFPTQKLYEAKNNDYAPLAELILASERIAQQALEPWEFKSLAQIGIESFILKGRFYDWGEWPKDALNEFKISVVDYVEFEELGGLLFFVKDENEKYRVAKVGDADYDFVRRLRQENALYDLNFVKTPTWAEQLFLARDNLEAYQLVWHELNTSDPRYNQSQNIRADAVIRETRRRMKSIPGFANDTELIFARVVKQADLVDVVSLSKAVAKHHAMTDGEACCWVTSRIQNENLPIYEKCGAMPPTHIIDENLADKALCASFEENWWNNPEALNKCMVGYEFPADEVAVLKVDAARCCAIPLELLNGNQRHIGERIASQNDAHEEIEILRSDGAPVRDIAEAIKGNQLKNIIDVWSVVQEILEVSRLDAVTFTERIFEKYRLKLYLDDEYLGLWFPVDSEDKQHALMGELGTSNFAHDVNECADGWENYRLLTSAYDKIIEVATSITGRVSEK